MKLLLTLLFNLFLLGQAHACPGCAGSMGNSNETNIVYILMIFIGLTYIPFYFLYRMIIKNRKSNTIGEENTPNS